MAAPVATDAALRGRCCRSVETKNGRKHSVHLGKRLGTCLAEATQEAAAGDPANRAGNRGGIRVDPSLGTELGSQRRAREGTGERDDDNQLVVGADE